MNHEEMLIRIDQKISNMKEDITEIKDHVKYTNGKIAEANIEIAKLKEKSHNCPARLAVNRNTKDIEKMGTSTTTWVQWAVMAIIAFMAAVNYF